MKRYILGIIILLITFCAGNVYATITYNASQITYTRNNVEIPLSSAMDELYSESADTVSNLNTCTSSLSACNNKTIHFGTSSYQQSLGNLTSNRSASVPLGVGTYIVAVTGTYGAINPSTSFNSSNTNNYSEGSLPLTCSNCTKTLISSRFLHPVASEVSTSYTASGKLLHLYSTVSVYYVNITSQTNVSTTLTMSWTGTWSAEDVAIMATPISIS